MFEIDQLVNLVSKNIGAEEVFVISWHLYYKKHLVLYMYILYLFYFFQVPFMKSLINNTKPSHFF